MMRLGFAFALAGGLCAGMASGANAATLSGCTKFEVPYCTVISSSGTKYNLVPGPQLPNNMWPIPANIGVTVVGEKVDVLGLCFSQTFRVTTWRRNRLHCPK